MKKLIFSAFVVLAAVASSSGVLAQNSSTLPDLNSVLPGVETVEPVITEGPEPVEAVDLSSTGVVEAVKTKEVCPNDGGECYIVLDNDEED